MIWLMNDRMTMDDDDLGCEEWYYFNNNIVLNLITLMTMKADSKEFLVLFIKYKHPIISLNYAHCALTNNGTDM